MTAEEIVRELDEAFAPGRLARLMGVTEKTVYSWSRGQKEPQPRHLAALLRLRDLLPEIKSAARDDGRAERLIA